jgi:hypothetical protein
MLKWRLLGERRPVRGWRTKGEDEERINMIKVPYTYVQNNETLIFKGTGGERRKNNRRNKFYQSILYAYMEMSP